mmetsp:Transcript_28886/g.43618  ORF Transcript_28886/g.43618 Transcript_28886/m.43618 type:complete len:928 (+) Transcript_28886:263-3046(+)|eukprot:CAMPEP_0178903928 /NCGR_PEP_ID=MMETSP0786-20121207/5421_1 /TAXON_ID=186022 /ORGANISM="Thalassionema frauenfeldii, Strain CCMP 1798" /LENGTH=927 /DNA_ID=CAMNT_0020575337 /DNA_START=201 /DNA_END=2984 /DNA_ORIENTATION=-
MSSQQANPQAGKGQPLPKKEGDLFKNLVKHYEAKQYKKAMKQADQILKKFPKHGETLAMKGLTLYYFSTDKHEEAHTLVKQGLTNDFGSHVCWHVYGLLHRADRNYGEAIKCYKQALRIDQENIQILRDLGLLQIQMRDLSGFVVTRNSILNQKPTLQPNWLAFMLAKQLLGQTEDALKVIDIYLETLKDGNNTSNDSIELLERNFAPSELQLYKSNLLLSLQEWEDALSHLKEMEHCIVDRGAYGWNTATCLFNMEKYDDCLVTLERLMKGGRMEDYALHAAYMCAYLMSKDTSNDAVKKWWPIPKASANYDGYCYKGMDTPATKFIMTEDQSKTLLELYQNDLLSQYPKSLATQRIPLTILWQLASSGTDEKAKEEWSGALDAYARKGLTKGVPSLGHDLSSLLLVESDNNQYQLAVDPSAVRNHAQYQQILKLLDDYITNLQEHSQLTSSNEGETKESPSTLFWAWYCRAGWYELSAQYSLALADMERCREHTPTAVDVYELEARILYKAGSLPKAIETMDKGRLLDLQDRYMNNQTTRYLLWNGQPKEALEKISMFLSQKEGPVQSLYDMQCSWYELELAACLERQGQYGRALKQYAAVLSHFDDIHEDQFDFHSYCIRKVTLRAYADVLEWEDVLWNQPFYRQAAEGTIRIYLHLHRNPPEELVEPDYSGMTAAEKKKAKAIARKKAAKKKKEAAAAAAEAQADNNTNDKSNKSNKKKLHPTEKDVEGKELLKKNALEECKKYSAILSKYAPTHLSTWLLQYDVSMERGAGKSLMALQALFKAKKVATKGHHPDVFSRILDFCSRPVPEDQPEVVQQVLREQIPILLDQASSVSDFVTSVAAEKEEQNCSMRLAVAKGLCLYAGKSPFEAAKFLVAGAQPDTVESCKEALRVLLEEWKVSDDSLISEWKRRVKDQFPLLDGF